MKKAAAIFKVLVAAMLILSFSVLPVFAEEAETTEISLINEDSGYKINVPGFIDVKTVEVEGDELTVVVMEIPQKDSNGDYSFFEIVTTDKNACTIQSYPGTYTEGQLGEYDDKFKDGKLMYKTQFDKDLKDIAEDNVFVFNFVVYDEIYEPLFSVEQLYFVFENKSTAAPTPATTPATTPAPTPAPQKATAVPTSSKVVVDGKQVAFDAYAINGNNYFKLRDLAMVMNGTGKQFQVAWDGAKNAINLSTNTAYTSVGGELAVSKNPTTKEAVLSTSSIYIDNELVQLTAYTIGGNNYFKLRDVAGVIDFGVAWDGKLNMIGIDTSTGYTE